MDVRILDMGPFRVQHYPGKGEVDLPVPSAILDKSRADTLFLLPSYIEGNQVWYPDGPLVRRLRDRGVEADFPYASGDRAEIIQFSVEQVVGIALYVADALGELGIQELAKVLWWRVSNVLSRQPDTKVVVAVDRAELRTAEGDHLRLDRRRLEMTGQITESEIESALRIFLASPSEPGGQDEVATGESSELT